MKFLHRNGEIEPPTELGRYWFDGTVDDEKYRGTVIVALQCEYVSVCPDIYLGQNRWAEFVFGGQWWGPVVPPWNEQDSEQETQNVRTD